MATIRSYTTSAGEKRYLIDYYEPKDIAGTDKPKKVVVRGFKKKKAAEETRKERAAKRKEYHEALMVAFSVSAQNMDRFASKYYIRDNNTDKQVMELLVESLASAWPMGQKFEYPLQDEQGNPTDTFEMTITEKGVGWKEVVPEPEAVEDADGKKRKAKKATPHKGVLTYKAIAEAIWQDWWDLDRVDPTDAQ